MAGLIQVENRDILLSEKKERNIVWNNGYITKKDRIKRNKHQSGLLWFTGIPSSGKSTIAYQLEKILFKRGIFCYVLDGDNIRHGLNEDLGFSPEHRKENIRRIVEVAKLMADAGVLVLAAFISPYREDRQFIRTKFHEGIYGEIYVKCSLEECERRDPKEHYRQAKMGLIKNYTGFSAPYEEPLNPDLMIDTTQNSVQESISSILEWLDNKKFLGEK
ncbi:MAG: adenylyl-sulfate kinase [Deltaproteobacteria bacterium]|nr:adenylyl-sulfate kinase [Deltaproteobacteria bacterium]